LSFPFSLTCLATAVLLFVQPAIDGLLSEARAPHDLLAENNSHLGEFEIAVTTIRFLTVFPPWPLPFYILTSALSVGRAVKQLLDVLSSF